MDKKTLYALIGGVAVIGAAVALYMSSSAEGEAAEEALDGDLEDLGELKLD